MASFKIKTKQDIINIKKELMNRKLSEKIDDQDFQENIFKFNKPTIEPLTEMKNQIQETNTVLKAITNTPKQSEIPQLEGPIADPPKSIGSTASHFLSKVYQKDYDHAYGVKFDEGNFYIGSKRVEIIGDNLVIDGEKFEMSENVWKLLNLANPGNINAYPKTDVDKYEDLMLRTTPFLRDDGNLKANRGNKYKSIIKPIYIKYNKQMAGQRVSNVQRVQNQQRRRSLSVSGEGIAFLPSDINELIKRHKLLFGALNSGNTGVLNEITAINDILLANKILSGEDLKSFYNIFYKK